MKDKLLKVLKIFIYIIAILAAFGFVFFFFAGIFNSLFADDIITAQNRVESAYKFIYMIGCGIVLVIALYSSRLIKVHILSKENEKKLKEIPSRIKSKFLKKNN